MPRTQILIIAIAALLAVSVRVQAQVRGPFSFTGPGGQSGILPAPLRPSQKPAVSPYLFLGEDRFSSALNYYQRVRPQQRFQEQLETDFQEIQNLNREITVLRQRDEARERGELQPTGHRAYYQNPGNYFHSTGSYYDRTRLLGR